MVRVKVCGITNIQDALNAQSMGADAIGFIFAESKRRITPKNAAKISASLGPWITKVGVFVNQSPVQIICIARYCGITCVQLHGSEKPSDVVSLKKAGLSVIKAWPVENKIDFKKLDAFKVDAFLFDTKIDNRFGGTSQKFDWNKLKGACIQKPVIVSGGLNAGNVLKAIQLTKPYAVDVSSGVEIAPGKKSFKMMKEFIANVKSI